MNSGVTLRPIVNEDREAFVKMAVEYFRELNPAFKAAADWQSSYFRNILNNSDDSACWILHDNQIAGFVIFGIEEHHFLPRTTGMIWEMYVLPGMRRMGIARKCAELAINHMRKHSPSKIRLEVMTGNESAAALWESLGFKRSSEVFILPLPSESWK
jgi:ribosomal protein S18 acetylase RimI-like enzyme